MRLAILFSLSYSLISFSCSPFCFFPFPAVAHHLCPRPSVAALPRSPLSSLRSAPSASPRIPRGCGRRHYGRAFTVGPFGRIASFEEVVVDFGDAAGAELALAAHVGLEIGHTRLFRLGWGSFLSRL